MRHGSNIDPPNRFEKIRQETAPDDLSWDQEHARAPERKIVYIDDDAKSIASENRSPDIPFRFSVNPYRGCLHGCAYCYARPGHEYLGLNAGLDFETKIVVKRDAPKRLREFLARPSWNPEPITFSGVTDCYQPAERTFRLTRQCLEVAWECRQPVSIVTKNALVLRDLDLLAPMAAANLVHVYVSITTLDPQLARDMEPRTSTPAARLRAVQTLAEHRVPVGVMTAPIIPGLNDSELPGLLQAAKTSGASCANYVLLRLPLTVEPVFREWLQRTRPEEADRVLNRIRQTRGGQMNESTWGQRMSGSGEVAQQIRKLFKEFQRKHGLDRSLPPHDRDQFRPPPPPSGQLSLF